MDIRKYLSRAVAEPDTYCAPCAPCAPPPTKKRRGEGCECGLVSYPKFGPEGGKPKDARWCATCKPSDAVDVKNKRCECGRAQPAFGPKGGEPKDARWCAKCPKKPSDAVDVKHKRCECGKARPIFAPEGGEHKDARWCAKCKPSDAVDVVSKMCLTEHCDTRGSPHLEGYCMACFSHHFPEHPRVRHARSEELAVLAAVYQRFGDEEWAQRMVSDRRVEGGCSRRRPDMFVDLGTHVLIVEVDERQHADYNTSCERRRMMELFEDAGSRPVVFLRFNPHAYTDVAGGRVRSPWTKDPKTGEPRVLPERRGEWTARVEALCVRIAHWAAFEGFPEQEVTLEHLFYDGHAVAG